MRELDSRVNGGIHVRLVWCEPDRRVLVTIYDAQTGRHHCIEVPEGERALQVFHHPYAYVSDAAPLVAVSGLPHLAAQRPSPTPGG